MKPQILIIIITSWMSLGAFAQQNEDGVTAGPTPETEEVVIIGERSIPGLRQQMFGAEKKAYEIFNKFNDERRFEISCSMQQPTGRHWEYQMCRPGFEIEARSIHAQAFLESYRTFLDPYRIAGRPSIDGSSSTAPNFQAVIASQQRQYKQKIKEVAEEHPEFLEAIIEYGELQKRYEASFNAGNK